MPNLAYHSALPFDFWDLLASLSDAISKLVLWYLSAFLASNSIHHEEPRLQVASDQYLLGLGECFRFGICYSNVLKQ